MVWGACRRCESSLEAEIVRESCIYIINMIYMQFILGRRFKYPFPVEFDGSSAPSLASVAKARSKGMPHEGVESPALSLDYQ